MTDQVLATLLGATVAACFAIYELSSVRDLFVPVVSASASALLFASEYDELGYLNYKLRHGGLTGPERTRFRQLVAKWPEMHSTVKPQ